MAHIIDMAVWRIARDADAKPPAAIASPVPSTDARANDHDGLQDRWKPSVQVETIGTGANEAEQREHCELTVGDSFSQSMRINSSYISRILRLTLLAPDIVEAIIDGRQPVEMTLAVLRPALLPRRCPNDCTMIPTRRQRASASSVLVLSTAETALSALSSAGSDHRIATPGRRRSA